MGIGAVSSAILQKLFEMGATWCSRKVGGTLQPKPPLGARRTSYRHCWSGHARGTRAIELPESPWRVCHKRRAVFPMLLKIRNLYKLIAWGSVRHWFEGFSPKWGGEKPCHQVRTPFPF